MTIQVKEVKLDSASEFGYPSLAISRVPIACFNLGDCWMSAQIEMPVYQCHKRVWALKIKEIVITETGDIAKFAILHFEEPGYGPLSINADYYYRHKPQAGGYYVVYEDDYKSFSPAKVFEAGYTLVN